MSDAALDTVLHHAEGSLSPESLIHDARAELATLRRKAAALDLLECLALRQTIYINSGLHDSCGGPPYCILEGEETMETERFEVESTTLIDALCALGEEVEG